MFANDGNSKSSSAGSARRRGAAGGRWTRAACGGWWRTGGWCRRTHRVQVIEGCCREQDRVAVWRGPGTGVWLVQVPWPSCLLERLGHKPLGKPGVRTCNRGGRAPALPWGLWCAPELPLDWLAGKGPVKRSPPRSAALGVGRVVWRWSPASALSSPRPR